ncbi:MAG: hypothetical protein LBP59_17730 [Planctomycetaceae bacterium]|nr:hypothetical protein [Planctomycetaceae bacterium]
MLSLHVVPSGTNIFLTLIFLSLKKIANTYFRASLKIHLSGRRRFAETPH